MGIIDPKDIRVMSAKELLIYNVLSFSSFLGSFLFALLVGCYFDNRYIQLGLWLILWLISYAVCMSKYQDYLCKKHSVKYITED